MTKLATLLQDIKTACGKAENMAQLRAAYSSFARMLTAAPPPLNEKCRTVYWENKHRILGTDEPCW